MQHGSLFLTLFIFGCIACSLVSTWIRASYGYPIEDGAGKIIHKENHSHGANEKALRAALSDRDARIAALEQRVRVLERIATDRRTVLEQEIEALRD